jgi:wobble nucleotide-excising tRNase
MKLDDFIVLGQQEDIDSAIAEQDGKVQRVRRAAELKAAAEPSPFPIPTEGAALRSLLARSIDGIAEDALLKVREHIAVHERACHDSPTAHESWLETGMAFAGTGDCPFCGQPLTERSLVDAYKDIFSSAYKELGSAVKRARDTLARYGSGDFRKTIERLGEQNAGNFRYWQEAAKVVPPAIGDLAAVIDQMDGAAARLDALFAKKQANLTEAIVNGEADDALVSWEEGRASLLEANNQVQAITEKIRSIKDTIDPAALPSLENQLKLLHAAKRRYEPEIVTQTASLIVCRKRKTEIAKEKAEVREALNKHGEAITAALGTAINTYLKRLNAGFRIDYQPPDYRGKEPSASYNILIREVPIAPRSGAGALDKPSFRNTLSGGDKSTLALALFLAKVNADPYIADTIVVLDDPFTSLDEFRRRFTAIEIRRLCGRALQTIVLSHEKYFLRHLWEKIDHSIICSLALQTGAQGVTTIAPYDIQAETRPRHVSERMKLDEFVEGEPHDPSHVRTRLRTVCEHFYRSGDPSLFTPDATLDQIIRILGSAPDEHPYKGALEDLRDINEFSRGDNHAAIHGDQSEDSSIEELKEWCRRVLDLTRGM